MYVRSDGIQSMTERIIGAFALIQHLLTFDERKKIYIKNTKGLQSTQQLDRIHILTKLRGG